MNIIACILGLIGGFWGLVVGLSGYELRSWWGENLEDQAITFLGFASIIMPISAIIGGGLSITNGWSGFSFLVVGFLGMLITFGIGLEPAPPLLLTLAGAAAAFLFAREYVLPLRAAKGGKTEPAPGALPAHPTASLDSFVFDLRETNFLQRLIGSQSFWVTVALIVICLVMSYLQPNSFPTPENFYNITRNFSFIGIMALGASLVIATGGIDLSVGSIMGLTAVACGLTLEGGYPWWLAIIVGFGAGGLVGLINGVFIADVGLSPFVATLGMLSIARSCAVVLSGNRMIYKFGPGGATFKAFGNGALTIYGPFQLSYPLLFLIVLAALLAWVYKMTAFGRHVLSIGGNESAALLTGVAVKRVKVMVYVLSGLAASFAGILSVGWAGSAINALGQSYELLAISAAVLGGANLMGGEASAYGAFIGAALIFVIRNALLMAGVDSNWQGTFVGLFLVAAVFLGKVRSAKRE